MEQLGFEGMPRRLYTCTPTRLSSWLDCPRRYRMSYLDRPVRGDLVVIGEVGLAGEVRAVTGLEARLKEAAALGFGAAVVPQSSLTDRGTHPLDVQGVGSVDEAVKVLLGP